MIHVEGTPYYVRQDNNFNESWNVIRPTTTGDTFVIAGPYPTRYQAEREALRRANAKSAKVYG